ncbi:MAG TPA: divalent-cation tolerance protein CutA [Opitutaceae bacterium]|jgi:periplasmic divalent cation tolerance protein|nr:divalent-cation tolerance protein CutA [Opitutaceae bacterium]HOY55374.1 divalent-cation tolerance protein CutA [Opitutaceae bacterium]HPG18098.1 divalent-cation tolerance protein CutA [Opitutaceae bacterium]HPO00549.1 divalent-cation tolerance protein CutA [Opitutaceae bacterium]
MVSRDRNETELARSMAGWVKGEFPGLPARAGVRERGSMLIAWTTLPSVEAANQLAADVVAQGLAACVQVDGPVTSHYRWEGKVEQTEEFRLCFKFLDSQQAALEAHVRSAHSYDTPEWIVVRAEHVGEKYLSWAQAVSTSSPL